MFKKLSLIGAALAMTGTALIPATEAAAQSRYEYRDGRGYDRGYDRGYRDDRRYRDARRYRGQDRRYRGRTDQRCDSSAGTIVGAIAGGLLGNSVAGRGDRAIGTILGGAVGAFAGREIDRSGQPRYCDRRR
ncbi:glycine zipper 2TM domain-containing protein [Sphingomonas sp. ST-64]|uniref:17 kDa surface antigen n=1 Tax=Sphingomonas plantiphila TaxID=3163295 RepID=A0ABW8YLE7_9SPHN